MENVELLFHKFKFLLNVTVYFCVVRRQKRSFIIFITKNKESESLLLYMNCYFFFDWDNSSPP